MQQAQSLKENGKEKNFMAWERPICPILQRHYELPLRDKIKFLETPEAQLLFRSLPTKARRILRDGFLSGTHGIHVPKWDEVFGYFQKNSRIIPALTKNPGTYTMLEKMYHLEPVWGEIDTYFLMCKAGGQALRHRFEVVNRHFITSVVDLLKNNDRILVIDLGSGPGHPGIVFSRCLPQLASRVRVENIDIDPEALAHGEMLAKLHNLTNIEFVRSNMVRLAGRYSENGCGKVDYGILIGVLCGLTRPERVGLLKGLRHYFKKGAKLIAASLLERMVEEDLLCAYILRETTGWGLQYPPLGELKAVFEEAGWSYEGYFQEEPTRFYEIGIGLA